MTELQIGLIGLGATAVVGVFAYNKWQEYRHRKLAEAVFKPQHEDVLLGDGPKVTVKPVPTERNEPGLGEEESAASSERVEPMFADVEPEVDAEDAYVPAPEYTPPPVSAPLAAEPPPAPAAVAQAAPAVPAPAPAPERLLGKRLEDESSDLPASALPAELLDPRLEFIVAMELVEPVSAIEILQSQRDVLYRLNKPVHWLGFNERSREWERLASDSNLHLRRLRVGLQLVNRMGPVSEGDVAIFANAMQALADELMAVADMPSSRVFDQAAEIDRFCAAVDLEIGVNLISRGNAFSGTKIRALAEAAGLVLGIDGLFTRYDEAGRAQFSLQNYENTPFTAESVRTLTTHGLTFVLDVPRVDHGERVFMQMTELAKRFADTLQGALVDDNRQPLSDAQLDHIRREFVGKPQATMASFGLPAGSAQALRLFS
ncbi:cell division protein ZipA C-terminal FtsZ-binding domain-containing protein [Dechloromonas denitrificans]|uniref:cell division protein ZipA C-terminal FtsZ-binding domain-containing protein n=1 Tax=Dechloromonas denitrificans TaxID=281362 RepID=UPI001CF9D8B7|nr:cell division protein ZipA C-terminal FtsZ-binding domain-containing protein [Dechloromonas denitrificans]UCV06611.1 cell division protein ZipA C-terminal FtsZ-binding domain-containing protein [Dechloromonas denitrificans]